MKIFRLFSPLRLLVVALLATSAAYAQSPLPQKPIPATPAPASGVKQIPAPLQPWETWATWNDEHRGCPTPYSDAKKHLCFWPSRMGLQVVKAGGEFDVGVVVFHETWVPLPGNREVWPFAVRADGALVPVVEHDGAPAVKLAAGSVRLTGSFRWNEVPQRIAVPPQIGILALVIDGQAVDAPTWGADGFVWLKRGGATEVADKNFLAVKLYAALEDGVPLWLRTEIELTVSGQSREEDLGTILPAGWKLASVESPIPVAVDDAGRAKAQVRAGKWTIRADAFHLNDPKEIRYAEGAKVAAAEQLVAFRAKPDFRIVEITGAPSIDVSQTTFPDRWRELPVYRWDTATPFRLEERMRGMGDQKPAGLSIARELWLDENGAGLTFRDRITGAMQQLWRLDAAEGQDLGSVRSGGQGQLLTLNPTTGAPGLEIRTRQLDLEATGRMKRERELPAAGWRTDAEALSVTLNLPPGWRLFALFGADWVRGDWLTAWTLLDLFLLLIFTLAVGRLWGVAAALLAFVAFGLSYHEPGAPRYLWLILLVPLALQRVVPAGWARRLLEVGKWTAIALFILVLVPFVARQVQQALYPQLEIVSASGRADAFGVGGHSGAGAPADFQTGKGDDVMIAEAPAAPPAGMEARTSTNMKPDRQSSGEYESLSLFASRMPKKSSASDNLQQDTTARIQTGPGVPEWNWREVSYGWSGPVTEGQKVKPLLISETLERVLSGTRVILLLALAAVLLSARKLGGTVFSARGKTTPAAVAITLLCALGSAHAQVPDQATLKTLRERLLAPSDAFPSAADIPLVALTLRERKLTLDAEIHAAVRTAVPLPGRLPAWSPVSVFVDDKPEVALRRDDGYLWLVVEPGVHRVRVEGSLAAVTEWEWTFLLAPRQVKIDAPGWTVTGVKPDGVPEAQVFFALVQKTAAGAASYERQEVQSIAVIDRSLELGLIWQVRTTLTRLSPVGKAVALRVPLLPGENVFSSNAVVRDGFIDVRLGAQETTFAWESGLAIGNALTLATRADDTWVERWHLVASPVWNVALAGLAPVFELGNPDLVPVWQPWPGESVQLAISRPEALAGATVTVGRATHEITLGRRQRTSKLDLALRCSLGEDFLVELPEKAEVTALTHNGKAIPVRQDGAKLIIPVRPGEQSVSIAWKENVVLDFHAQAGAVRLPVESANVQTIVTVPEDRWVLWADGPRRGPAVRFWVFLACSLLAAILLGRAAFSPLSTLAWMLLVIGLTQVWLPAALTVIAWLFLLEWRGSESFQRLGNQSYNALQVFLIALTALALGILFTAVGEGLLGTPEMFIVGNGSTSSVLRWFQARSDGELPRPGTWSISIWWYRFFMLAWALWLAASLIRWLRRGWEAFSRGGFFRAKAKAPIPPASVMAAAPVAAPGAPPPLPTK